MEIHGNAGKYGEMHGNAWKYMEMWGNAWKYMEIHGNVGKCMEMHGNAMQTSGWGRGNYLSIPIFTAACFSYAQTTKQ
ncbi:MAG: hypothetical protein H6559_01385 [Lewinellaceae bacterium]|nr:hypothetical protein [Lewinellaceae bacterium]